MKHGIKVLSFKTVLWSCICVSESLIRRSGENYIDLASSGDFPLGVYLQFLTYIMSRKHKMTQENHINYFNVHISFLNYCFS